ncbi:MAG: DegV family protein [Clostridiales bacterium]|nr:DegV family protein [Clostridiales bacterium]
MAIKIVIDSAADIAEKEAKELGVEMVPLVINFGVDEYYDGVDLLPTDFYNKLLASKILPKTSQVSPFRFEEVFQKIIDNGDEVLVITISSKLSGTYASAVSAAEKFNGKVMVVDSLSAAIGEWLLCQEALKMIENGYNLEQIYTRLNNLKENIVIMAVLDTLTYLKKGGRISGTVALVGGILNIKPIVSLIDGEVKMIGKTRGQKKGALFMNGIINADKIDLELPFGALYSGNDRSIGVEYANNIKKYFNDVDMPVRVLGSTIGTHVGPGIFGVAYFKK